MNEQTLTQEFERAVQDEPPLGFDPDQVVTRAGLRRHRRRVSMLAGGGVAAVALLAAAAVPLLRGGSSGSEQVGPAGSAPALAPAPAPSDSKALWPPAALAPAPEPSDGKALWPPAGVTPAHPTDAQLDRLKSSVASNLEVVLPKVAPGAGSLEITSFPGHLGSLSGPVLGVIARAHVGPTDKGYTVNVEALVPAAPVRRFAPEQECVAAKQQISTTMTCSYSTLANGRLLMIQDWQVTDRAGSLQRHILVTDYRSDGSFVEATSLNDASTDGQSALTVDQLTRLATDPGFRLS